MQQLFLVGGKLLGIFFLLGGLVQTVFLLAGGNRIPASNATLLATWLAQLIAGGGLAFFTRPLLNLVGLRGIDQAAPRISPRSALEVGCILLGLMEFVGYVPQFVNRLEVYHETAQTSLIPLGVGEAVALAVSLGLVFGARPIAGFIWAANSRRQRAIGSSEEPASP
jgi:hypothetical protein